jgi:hypothetical protein
MRLVEIAMAAAITASVSGMSYVALNPQKVKGDVQVVADRATCRTVDTAILGFLAVNGTEPTEISQLRDFVRGDISAYAIKHGVATGPGC